jgi:hypothetical protein
MAPRAAAAAAGMLLLLLLLLLLRYKHEAKEGNIKMPGRSKFQVYI